MKETLTRAARERRVVAIVAWAGLILASFNLWNSRMIGAIRVTTPEPVAFLMAAFSAFVGVFAWMLFNPGRRSAADSPSLFLAAGATLFPPSVIAWCLMPADSPLRWWLTLGIFFLCVIAVLSHVPDEFFAVPRNRSTYLTPVPTFDRLEGNQWMDPDAEWFSFSDLSRIVADGKRPSLAPRAYLQQPTRPTPAATTHSPLLPVSDIDDILGADFDEDLFADDLITDDHDAGLNPAEKDQSGSLASALKDRVSRFFDPSERPEDPPTSTEERPTETKSSLSVTPRTDGPPAYDTWNRASGRLTRTRDVHRDNQSAADVAQPDTRQSFAGQQQTTRPSDGRPNLPPSDPASASVSAHHSELATESTAEAAASTENASAENLSADNDRGSYRRKDRGDRRKLRRDHKAETPQPATPQARKSDSSSHRPRTRGLGVAPLTTSSATAAVTSSTAATTETPATGLETVKGRRTLPDFDRIQDDDGTELVEGVMTIRFAEGQKRANLHVPFAPPLPGVPTVECECVNGENLRLKVPVKQSYGIRIEARRSDASEPLEAEIRFAATYSVE